MKKINYILIFFFLFPFFLYSQEKKEINFQIKGKGDLSKITLILKVGQDDIIFAVNKNGSTYQLLNPSKKGIVLEIGTYNLDMIEGSKTLLKKKIAINSNTPKTVNIDVRNIQKTDSKKQVKTLKELVITSDKKKESSKNILLAEESKFIPGTAGDPLKAVKNLPGVVNTGSAILDGLYVRGGNQGDVLYTIDDIKIGNPYHNIGFYSVFASEMIDSTDFYPSAYPFDFGNTQGAAINILSRSDNPQEISGVVDLNIGIAFANLIIPLIKNKLDLYTSFKRSNYEIYLAIAKSIPEIPRNLIDFPAPVFFDNYNKLSWKIDSKQSLSLLVIGKYDDIKIATSFPFEDEDSKTNDVLIENAFRNYWNTAAVTYLWDSGKMKNKLIVSQLFERNNVFLFGSSFSKTDATKWSIQDKWSYQMNDSFNFKAGVEYTYDEETGEGRIFSQREVFENQQVANRVTSDYAAITNTIEFFSSGNLKSLDDFNRHSISFYGGFDWKLNQFIFSLGAFSTYKISEKFNYFIDPRLEITYLVNDHYSIFTRIGKYSQLPPLIEQIPMEFPKKIDDNITSPYIEHYVLGLETKKLPLDIKGELYYQNGIDQILPNPELDPSKDLDPKTNPTTLNSGYNRGYGAEILIKKKFSKKQFGWLAYTYSVAQRYEYKENSSVQEWIFFNEDVTHQVNLVYSYKINKNWRIGTRANITSGKPRTETLLVFNDKDSNGKINRNELSYLDDNNHRNQARNPYNYRLDFRVDYITKLFGGELNFYLDFWNIEGFFHQNILGYQSSISYLSKEAPNQLGPGDFNSDNQRVVPTSKLQSTSQVPPFLPLLGVQYKF